MRFTAANQTFPPLKSHAAIKKLSSLHTLFKKQSIDLLFLHGSLARDQHKTLSDLDIAILFQPDYDFKDVAKLFRTLSELFGRDDIDIVVLNNASPLLWMHILHDGRLIYCRNKTVLKQFRLKTFQRYLSTKHLRRTFHEAMQAAIMRQAV